MQNPYYTPNEQSTLKKILSQSESMYSTLVEKSIDGIAIYQDGLLKFVNTKILELTGYSRKELIDKSFIEVLASPAYKELVSNMYKKRLAGEDVPSQYRAGVQTKDGKDIPVEVNISPIDYEGKPAFMAILRDITKRIQAEDALKKSELKFRHLFEELPDAIYLIQLGSENAGKIFDANPAAVLQSGYSRKELIGMNIIKDLSAEPLSEQEFIKAEKDLVDGKTVNFIEKKKRADGSEYWTQVKTTKFEYDDRDVALSVSVNRDITELKLAEEALIEAKDKAEEINKLKSNILTNMSHELRTPLSGILGYAEMLSSEIEDEFQSELVTSIHQNGLRLLKTLNSLLNLSKLESEEFEYELVNVDISKILKSTVAALNGTVNGKNLELKTEIKIDSLRARLDEIIFIQILTDLINNAITFTDEGQVIVTADSETDNQKQWVVISIKDTGIGLSPDSIKYIFDPFRQVSEGLARKYEGVGLGLTLVKKYVTMMDGEIFVESELGKGSTFSIKFPASYNSEVRSEKKMIKNDIETPTVSDKKISLPRVLLVENETASVKITNYYLKDMCIIDDVDNGKDALRMLTEKSYDAVIMDIDLAGEMDGLETTRQIRKLSNYKSIPIIALTAYALKGEEQRCYQAGCTHYISKPFERDHLVNQVSVALKLI